MDVYDRINCQRCRTLVLSRVYKCEKCGAATCNSCVKYRLRTGCSACSWPQTPASNELLAGSHGDMLERLQQFVALPAGEPMCYAPGTVLPEPFFVLRSLEALAAFVVLADVIGDLLSPQPDHPLFEHLDLRFSCARLYKRYFWRFQLHAGESLGIAKDMFQASFALIDYSVSVIDWEVVSYVVRFYIASLSEELPDQLKHVVQAAKAAKETGAGDVEEYFNEELALLMSSPGADYYGSTTWDKLYYASDRLLKDDGLVMFTNAMFDPSCTVFKEYFLNKEERAIEQLLHWIQAHESGTGICDEETCEHWFTQVFFKKLIAPESLNYPVYLNVVHLVLADCLDYKFVFTGDPSEVVVEF